MTELVMGMGLFLVWCHRLICIVLSLCKHACKEVCDVKPGIDPYPFLARSWNGWCTDFLTSTAWKKSRLGLKRGRKVQCVLNRCKELFKRKKYFGVKCTLINIRGYNEDTNVSSNAHLRLFKLPFSGWLSFVNSLHVDFWREWACIMVRYQRCWTIYEQCLPNKHCSRWVLHWPYRLGLTVSLLTLEEKFYKYMSFFTQTAKNELWQGNLSNSSKQKRFSPATLLNFQSLNYCCKSNKTSHYSILSDCIQ